MGVDRQSSFEEHMCQLKLFVELEKLRRFWLILVVILPTDSCDEQDDTGLVPHLVNHPSVTLLRCLTQSLPHCFAQLPAAAAYLFSNNF